MIWFPRARYVLLPLGVALLALAAGELLAWRGAAAQPPATMTLSPSSGPCDGSVTVTGSGFPTSTSIRLDLAGPHSDGTMGKLGSVTTDGAGMFSVDITLGALGCEAARLDTERDSPGELKNLRVYADFEVPPPRQGSGIPPVLTSALYGYTTTDVAALILPATGTGSEGTVLGWGKVALAVVLGCGGLLLVAAGVSVRRQQR